MAMPPERLKHTAIHRLAPRLPTRLSGNLQAAQAHDPYYETFHDVVRVPSATSVADAREMATCGGLSLPAAYRGRAPKWPDDFLRPTRLNSMLNLLGVLSSYRVVTNNQAAALVGDRALADPRSDLVSDLFRCGVLDLASPYLGHSLGVAGGGTTAYQIGDAKLLRELERHLTWAESFAVTGNRPLPSEPVNLRHDILGAELALRAAENLRVGTVLGPHFSRFADLTVLDPVSRTPKGGPDLTIIRDDGLRIAVEITSSIGERFAAKVRRWVRTLNENSFDQSGLVVVFVVAPSPAALSMRGARVRRECYRQIAAATRESPGSHRDPAAARIGVATWREWFPAPLIASEHFTRLTVDRPTGRSQAWESCDLWDPADMEFPAADPQALREVIRAAALLSQTPAWLRWPHEPARQIAELLREAAGEPRAVAPLRERSAGRQPGVGQGVADDALLPIRLLGPTDQPECARRQPVIDCHHEGPQELAAPVFGHRLRPAVKRRAA